MSSKDAKQQEKLAKVKKRVESIKGFYIHALVYVLVNAGLICLYFLAKISDPATPFWPLFTMVGWGIGLAIHGVSVFILDKLFSEKWEEEQIKKMMKED